MLVLLLIAVVGHGVAVERKESTFHFLGTSRFIFRSRNIIRTEIFFVIPSRQTLFVEDTSLMGCVRIGWHIVTDVSKDRIASIFRDRQVFLDCLNLEMKALRSLQMYLPIDTA
jgi:hypothetical protein